MIKVTLFPLAAMLILGSRFDTPKEAIAPKAIALCEAQPRNENLNQQGNNIRIERNEDERVTTILIEIVPEMMKFDLDSFKVKAGDKIILEIDNLDGMQHNLLIAKPGTLDKVGAAADAMLRDPKASEKFYIPEIPEVLFSTKMIGPQELYTLTFTAPTEPGNYPFVCTFPGHWRMMNGIMKVES
ncbi:plastocyanin/azurin family copper-binding protein [Algoriphagus sp. D3-2-R+10]|uniref:plastocyanin/azurin family copper-binding protein n=1 Tax=Algoriphagus aurantiacus TaxID=3103948 RepID=UPI002B3BD25A|nr:plastocyanin/azurin family copper-binding protein [Algoriphagus sp. D3-2-R+10]MEB2773836.1 plastocyanin/azurin family copper-binding protein [Algoriphagus sp. D3-2-R+10]